MRAVVQRASSGSVSVDSRVVGSLPCPGLVVLLGVHRSDTEADAVRLADRIWRLRILEGNCSASDLQAPLLVISQFTLYADTRKGRRPSWSEAAPAPVAESLVNAFCEAARGAGAHVETGIFGAMMEVSLVNSGPVTLILDS